MITRDPTVTELINSSNAQLRSLYDEARKKHNMLTALRLPSGADTFVVVMPHWQANEIVRLLIHDPQDSRRVTTEPINDTFVVYAIVKDQVSRFQKPVSEFLARPR